jgi:hypothetical protein
MTREVQAGSPRLIELEKQIDGDMFAIAVALKEIHDDQLYETAGFKSFDSYLKTRWRFSRSYAYRQIKWVEQVKLSPNGDNIPETEGAAAQ